MTHPRLRHSRSLLALVPLTLLLPNLAFAGAGESFRHVVSVANGLAWGPPMILLLVGTGLYLTVRMGLIQFRGFRHGLRVLRGHYDHEQDPGELSHFRALATALSATIGTGNIVGVAAAILTGGPGAVFWMWITALVGMATKFTCCTLAVHYRRVDARGECHGGPMHYIELGMGPRWKWLAVLFAVFTVLASFGIGNMFQANNVMTSLNSLLYGPEAQLGSGFRIVMAVGMALAVGVVILGGLRRIASISGRIVPVMVVFYLGGGLLILLTHASEIPAALATIFHAAFHAPEAVAGGLLGGVIRNGVARGLFSNEAGLGSAPIAHGAARTSEPVREGLVAMLGPFIDTIVVCSITALVIVITGADAVTANKGLLTSTAFELGLPGSGWMVNLSIILFAYSTLIAWSYYGDRAADYLFGPRAVRPYRIVYTAMAGVGCLIQLNTVIDISDTMNGFMAVPNLIALVVLSPVVARLLRDYLARHDNSAINPGGNA